MYGDRLSSMPSQEREKTHKMIHERPPNAMQNKPMTGRDAGPIRSDGMGTPIKPDAALM
jgi:hypothetical protein